jgi:hypothetical protein
MKKLLIASLVFLAACGGDNAVDAKESKPPKTNTVLVTDYTRSYDNGFAEWIVNGHHCIIYRNNTDTNRAQAGLSCDWSDR